MSSRQEYGNSSTCDGCGQSLGFVSFFTSRSEVAPTVSVGGCIGRGTATSAQVCPPLLCFFCGSLKLKNRALYIPGFKDRFGASWITMEPSMGCDE